MRYIIKNTNNGKFVSKPGDKYSYTENLSRAKIFKERKSAENDCCENEIVLNLDDFLNIY